MPEVWFPYLGIEIEKLNGVAFTIFGFQFYKYGIIIGMAIVLATLLVLHEAKRSGQNPDIYVDFAMYAIFLSIIGARIYYVIFSWEMYRDNPMKIFAFREGGLAIYGAVIAGIATGFVYSKVKKQNFLVMADTVLPSLMLGQMIGRWGNFFNREAFGGYTDGIFAMRYIKDQVGHVTKEVAENTVIVNGVEYIQVHPTFLYESLWNLCWLIFLLVLRRRKKFNGQIGALYLIGYGLGRVWIEGLRTDQLIIGNTGIAVSQLLSAFLIVFGIVVYIFLKKRGQTE